MKIINNEYSFDALKSIEIVGLREADISRINCALNFSEFTNGIKKNIPKEKALVDFSKLLGLVGSFPELIEVVPVDLEPKCAHVLFRCQDLSGHEVLVRFSASLFGDRVGWFHVIDNGSYDMTMVRLSGDVVTCHKVCDVNTDTNNYYGNLYNQAYNITPMPLEYSDEPEVEKIITFQNVSNSTPWKE